MTTQALPILKEVHTSDLTASCLRSVLLRHAGKIEAEMTTALFRGLLAGECLRFLHERNEWDKQATDAAVIQGTRNVHKQSKQENRPVTEAVTKNLSHIQGEVLSHLNHYAVRIAPIVHTGRVIGCELPCRVTLELNDEPVDFASHLDLLWRTRAGELICWDWKWQDEAPTYDYLGRNLQFGLYYLMLAFGEIQLPDGEWVTFGEFPQLAWIDLDALKPYGRAGTVKQNGEDVQYKKGDVRPIDRIIRPVHISPTKEQAILDELALRWRMMQAGHYPTNPSKLGCYLCESKKFCPNFLTEGEAT